MAVGNGRKRSPNLRSYMHAPQTLDLNLADQMRRDAMRRGCVFVAVTAPKRHFGEASHRLLFLVVAVSSGDVDSLPRAARRRCKLPKKASTEAFRERSPVENGNRLAGEGPTSQGACNDGAFTTCTIAVRLSSPKSAASKGRGVVISTVGSISSFRSDGGFDSNFSPRPGNFQKDQRTNISTSRRQGNEEGAMSRYLLRNLAPLFNGRAGAGAGAGMRPSWRLLSSARQEPQPESDGAVRMTENCVRRLKELHTADSSGMLRLTVDSGGCSGFQYSFSLDNEKNEDDRVFEQDGMKLVVDNISYDFVKGSSVDFVEELISSKFQVVENPNALKGCSCKSSFMV